MRIGVERSREIKRIEIQILEIERRLRWEERGWREDPWEERRLRNRGWKSRGRNEKLRKIWKKPF